MRKFERVTATEWAWVTYPAKQFPPIDTTVKIIVPATKKVSK